MFYAPLHIIVLLWFDHPFYSDIKPKHGRNKERAAINYRVIVEQDEDGFYVVEAPANIKEAIEPDLDSLEAHGESVPPSALPAIKCLDQPNVLF
jgi:predicted RNase H-like HicB family nuclease